MPQRQTDQGALPSNDDISEDTLTSGLDMTPAEMERRRDLVEVADRIRAMTPKPLTVSSVELLREDRAR